MTKKPKIVNRKVIAKSRIFCIETLDLIFSNGEKREYERLAREGSSGAVIIVPMLDPETVLLVKEYSAGIDQYEIGLSKGKIDPGETALEAANRELKEEVGYGAKRLHLLATLSIAPAYMAHTIDVVIAEDLYEERLEGDEPEELEVIPWKLGQIPELLATGECSEARSIAALYMANDYLKTR